MTTVSQKISVILLAAAVFGAGVVSSTHTHVHGDGVSGTAVEDCTCLGHQHGTDSDAPFSPCDHEDCQLCKFLCSFGWLPSQSLELESQDNFQFLSVDDYALIKRTERKSYLGRAPPIA